MRYFNLEEAESLIPKIKSIAESATALQARASIKARDYDRLCKLSNSDAVSLALLKGQIEFLISQAEDQLKQISKLGAIPKGIDPCLVDFPGQINNQKIYFCWRYPENTISHYHGLGDGFAGRKLLPAGTFLQN